MGDLAKGDRVKNICSGMQGSFISYASDRKYCWIMGIDDRLYMSSSEYIERMTENSDPVNHPSHYTSDPSGIECIDIVEHKDFLTGNIIKYAWRAGSKAGNTKLQDLEKCLWYANRAVELEKKRIQCSGT